MIKIRYAVLDPGVHVKAEQAGRDTIVCLLPGLTSGERRAALSSACGNGRMGLGPYLPPAGLRAAVARDQAAATLRNGTAAFRVHPLVMVPLVLLVTAGTVAFVMLSAAVIRFPQGAPGEPPVAGPSAAAVAPVSRMGGAPPVQLGGEPAGRHRARAPATAKPPRPPVSPGPSGTGLLSPSALASLGSALPVPSPAAVTPAPPPGACVNLLGAVGVCLR